MPQNEKGFCPWCGEIDLSNYQSGLAEHLFESHSPDDCTNKLANILDNVYFRLNYAKNEKNKRKADQLVDTTIRMAFIQYGAIQALCEEVLQWSKD